MNPDSDLLDAYDLMDGAEKKYFQGLKSKALTPNFAAWQACPHRELFNDVFVRARSCASACVCVHMQTGKAAMRSFRGCFVRAVGFGETLLHFAHGIASSSSS